jgi:hypothetical protein
VALNGFKPHELFVDPVPVLCEYESNSVTDETSDNDDSDGSSKIKWSNDKRHTHHMCPLTEVYKTLRPTECDENGPHEMYGREELADD